MDPHSRLEDSASALRDAVGRRDFAGAEAAARDYSAQLTTGIEAMPAAAALDQLKAACQLIEWARRRFIADRARIASELSQLQVASQYQTRPQPDRHALRILG